MTSQPSSASALLSTSSRIRNGFSSVFSLTMVSMPGIMAAEAAADRLPCQKIPAAHAPASTSAAPPYNLFCIFLRTFWCFFFCTPFCMVCFLYVLMRKLPPYIHRMTSAASYPSHCPAISRPFRRVTVHACVSSFPRLLMVMEKRTTPSLLA